MGRWRGDSSDFVAHLHYEIFSLSLVTLTFCCLPLDWCASFDRVEFKPVRGPIPPLRLLCLKRLLAVCIHCSFRISHWRRCTWFFFIMINIVALIRRQSQSVSSSLVLPLSLPLPHLLLICSLVWCESFPQAAAAVVASNEMTPREEADWGKMLMNCQGIGMN